MKFDSKSLFSNLSQDLHAAVGELVGTVMFLLLAMGSCQAVSTNLTMNTTLANAGDNSTDLMGATAARLIGVYYISASFGFSLFAIASIFYRFTGSIFNPNVALALVLVGAIKPARFILVVLAEFLGSIIASAILSGLTPGPLGAGVALGGGTSRTQGLFIEMFTTATLVLSILMMAAEKTKVTPFAPFFFGMTLFAVMLWSTEYTGGAVNTARAFGPAVISGFSSYHWIYWLGPTLGSLMSAAFYYFLKRIEYWKINPQQDSDDPSHSPLHNISQRKLSLSSSTNSDINSSSGFNINRFNIKRQRTRSVGVMDSINEKPLRAETDVAETQAQGLGHFHNPQNPQQPELAATSTSALTSDLRPPHPHATQREISQEEFPMRVGGGSMDTYV